MKRLLSQVALVLVLIASTGAAAKDSVQALARKLGDGVDFRIRVQAALELGKSGSYRARPPLESALDDDNAAVRAAAAAALKVLGNPAAIGALRKHERDSSPAVRAQVKSSIAALRKSGGSKGGADKAELLVRIGKIRNGSRVKSKTVVTDVARASREKLDGLPGVDIVNGTGRSTKKLPVVMVTGRVKKLQRSREGALVVYSASVEFVLHKMPGQTIKGVVSGSARASGSVRDIRNRKAMADLRRSALEAAIESAVRRAPPALRAAVE